MVEISVSFFLGRFRWVGTNKIGAGSRVSRGTIFVVDDPPEEDVFRFWWVFLRSFLSWKWGWVETSALILAGVAIVLWLKWSAKKALWAYMAAAYVSTMPLLVDYWNVPQPSTLWLWLWTVGTCLLAIYGSERRDFANTFVPWGALVLIGFIAVLCVL